mgnify:CR=1 FL=1
MKRFSTISLMLEFMGAVLAALVLSNVALVLLANNQRSQEMRYVRIDIAAARLVTLIDLLPKLSPDQQRQYLFAASGRGQQLDLSPEPIVPLGEARHPDLESRVRAAFAGPQPEIRIATSVMSARAHHGSLPGLQPPRDIGEGPHFGAHLHAPGSEHHPLRRLALAIHLADGRWLNVQFMMPQNTMIAGVFLHSLFVTAAALVLASIWMGLRIAGPLRRLAQAATAMQPGEPVPEVPERGPQALRYVIGAFNAMSKRLMSTLDNQRSILAAIAHDLRTPITSLKLRTELLDDAELKERMNASLDELQSLTESALSALKSGGSTADMRAADLTSLIESLCEDQAELGLDVEFAAAPPLTVICRPEDIRRALRNLIENAARYGGRARVRLARHQQSAEILIEDDGPGIPPDRLESVFEPFRRIETSRSRETGGQGLGLTIARTIARAHGGDVVLENRAGGGLTARLRLPVA